MIAGKSFRQSRIGKALFVSAFSFICSVSSVAKAEDGLLDLIQKNEDAANSLGKDELLRLHSFSQSVEKDAFATTMKLCQGYRVSIGLPALPAGHEAKGYAVEDSLAAWANILNQGFWVRISNEFGQKGYYNDKIANYDTYDIRGWYTSMYTVYLINSPGFFYAAQHCLNTTSARDFYYFADAIVLADMAGTTAYDLSVFKASGLVIRGAIKTGTFVVNIGFVKSFIAKSSWLVLRPAAYVKNLLARRVFHYMPLKVMIGTIAIPMIADNAGIILNNKAEIESAVDERLDQMVKEKPLSEEDQQLKLRYKTLEHGFLLMKPVLENQKDQVAQAKMTEFEAKELTPEKIVLYLQDGASIAKIEESQRSEQQANYLDLLDVMQPLFNGARAQN
jgi:hypothetical protein